MTQVNLFARVRSGARVLGLNIGQAENGCIAIALESPTDSFSDINAILENHAHHVIGTFDTVEAAQAACDAYAKEWLRRRKSAPRCKCKEVAA